MKVSARLLALGVFTAIMLLSLRVSADDTEYFLESGHTIQINKNIVDWVGLPPLKDNSGAIDKGEFIWKDAKGDDVGAGNYVYPSDVKLQKGADIREFRVTYDDKKLYLMIKCDRPNDWWVPYRIVGIDTDGATGGTGGNVLLAQGDIDELDTYNGCYGELKVDESLACEYVVGLSSTYKGRIWDEHGNLVSYIEGDEKKVKGFNMADANWYALEVSLPYDIIGDPRGKTWRFIVATATQDNDIFREVYATQTEWHPGGSQDPTELEDGMDPDAFDLVGADEDGQIADLSSYNPDGSPGDPASYCTIKNSYITIKFGQ